MGLIERFNNHVEYWAHKDKLDNAVATFHEQLNLGNFAAIFAAAHTTFKRTTSKKAFVAMLDAIHTKLGNVLRCGEPQWTVTSEFVPHLDAHKTNILLTYQTQFTSGDATETFNYRLFAREISLYDYSINSSALTRLPIERNA